MARPLRRRRPGRRTPRSGRAVAARVVKTHRGRARSRAAAARTAARAPCAVRRRGSYHAFYTKKDGAHAEARASTRAREWAAKGTTTRRARGRPRRELWRCREHHRRARRARSAAAAGAAAAPRWRRAKNARRRRRGAGLGAARVRRDASRRLPGPDARPARRVASAAGAEDRAPPPTRRGGPQRSRAQAPLASREAMSGASRQGDDHWLHERMLAGARGERATRALRQGASRERARARARAAPRARARCSSARGKRTGHAGDGLFSFAAMAAAPSPRHHAAWAPGRRQPPATRPPRRQPRGPISTYGRALRPSPSSDTTTLGPRRGRSRARQRRAAGTGVRPPAMEATIGGVIVRGGLRAGRRGRRRTAPRDPPRVCRARRSRARGAELLEGWPRPRTRSTSGRTGTPAAARAGYGLVAADRRDLAPSGRPRRGRVRPGASRRVRARLERARRPRASIGTGRRRARPARRRPTSRRGRGPQPGSGGARRGARRRRAPRTRSRLAGAGRPSAAT